MNDPEIARLLIDSVSDYAIFVLDPRGYVQTWNRGAQRVKGYRPSEIIGKHFSTFYTPQDRDSGLPDALLVRAETEGSVEHSGWRVRRDGTTFWGNVVITALRADDGNLVGFAKVTRDMTDVHAHEEALRVALARERQASTELERLHRTRTRFLAAIVHDLSTPITVIRSSLQMAMEDLAGQRPDLEPLLEGSQRNAEDLERLRAQLQEFSRLEGGSVSLHLTPVELAKVAQQVADDLAQIAGRGRIVTDIEPEVCVLADELALRRILTNLVTNALRFTPPHEPVRVTTGPSSDPDRLAIGVADRGPGIAPEDQHRVFLEFWTGRGGTRPEGGLGLGLNIVQGYVREHGGDVWIESDQGHGATFWFTLQRVDAPPAG